MKTKQTYSINFFCRASKANKKGLAPVELAILVNGERTLINLPRKEKPSEFKKFFAQKKQNETKDFCNAQYAMAQTKIAEMIKLNLPISAFSIKNYILNGNTVYTVERLFDDYFKLLDGKTMSVKNYNKYIHMREEFFKVFDKHLSPSQLDSAVVQIYQNALLKKFQPSTISGYMSKLKSVVTYGMAKGYIKQNPFYNIKIDRRLKAVTTITEEEYYRMRDKYITNDRLAKVRDYFVFACNCGLAYCDVVNLRPCDFVDIDGMTIINKERVKTKIDFYSVVLEDGIEILKKYDYDLSPLYLSNQKLNSYAKELASICEITSVDSLHSHLCRHYYLTKIINDGIPLEIVSRCAGHSRVSMTKHYAQQLKSNIIKDVVDAFK